MAAKRTRAHLNGLLALALLVAGCGGMPEEAPVEPLPDVEAPAPAAAPAPDLELTLPLMDGGTFRTSDYRGRVVLLNFWATWCPPCREEIPDLIALHEALKDRGFEVVGIAMDLDPEVVPPFVEEFAIPYPIAYGTQETTQQIGGVLGLPVSLLIGPDGQLAGRFVGLFPVDEVRPFIEEMLADAM